MTTDPESLPSHIRQLRSNIRSFLLTATNEELLKELAISKERKDEWRVKFIEEILEENGI